MDVRDTSAIESAVVTSLADLLPHLLNVDDPTGIPADRKGADLRFRHALFKPE